MGKKDTITKDYMNDPRIFADAFNYFIYHGKQVISPEDLYPLDTAEIALPYGVDGKIHPVQRFRDNFKYMAAMQDKDTAYLLLGVEDQSEIHYAMPVKNMLYDSMEYASQVDKISREHRRHMNAGKNHGKNFLQKISSGEFLSGFYKEDRLTPVITLVLYFGPDKWDGPVGIHDMMDIREPALLPYILLTFRITESTLFLRTVLPIQKWSTSTPVSGRYCCLLNIQKIKNGFRSLFPQIHDFCL